MTTQLRRRRRRTVVWLAAGLLLAAAGVFSPSTARAGCSHRVTVSAQPLPSGAFSVDRLVAGDLGSADASQDPPPYRMPDSPCAGLRCSEDSIPPHAQPPETQRVKFFGCCDNSAVAFRSACSPLPRDDDNARSLDRVDRLARPPR